MILMENLTSCSYPSYVCFRQFELHCMPRADLFIAFCFRGDNDSFLLGIGLHFLSLRTSILLSPLPFYPSLHPTSSHQMVAAGAPSTTLYRSVTARARDERQIKTTLFPLSPSHRARLNLRFFIFFLIFLFSLPPLASTQNYLEPSCLTT